MDMGRYEKRYIVEGISIKNIVHHRHVFIKNGRKEKSSLSFNSDFSTYIITKNSMASPADA